MKAYNARKKQSVLKRKFIKGATRLVRGDLGCSLKRKDLYIKSGRRYIFKIEPRLWDENLIRVNEKEEILLRREIKRRFKLILLRIYNYEK